MSQRIYAYALSAAIVVAVLWPITRHPDDDSFPLSTYPMFSRGRPSSEMILAQALAVRDDGTRRPVPPHLVFNSEVLQSMTAIERAIYAGPGATDELCRAIAARAATSDEEAVRGASQIELVSSRFDSLAYFEGHTEPASRHVYGRCDVRRP